MRRLLRRLLFWRRPPITVTIFDDDEWLVLEDPVSDKPLTPEQRRPMREWFDRMVAEGRITVGSYREHHHAASPEDTDG